MRAPLRFAAAVLVLAGAASAGTTEPVRRYVLSNGLTVVAQTDPASTVSVVEILIKGGLAAEEPGREGLAYLSARLAMDIQDQTTARDFMVKALQYAMTARDDDAVIRLECLTEFLDEALAVYVKILTDPLFTNIRIDRLVEGMDHQRRIRSDDALSEAGLAQRKALLGGSGYDRSLYGTEASLKAVRGRDVKEFYDRLFTAGNMVVAAVSDLDPETLRALLEKRFQPLRPGAPPPDEREPVVPLPPPAEPRTIVKDQRQSVVSCAFALPPLTRRDFLLVSLIENVLGRGPGSRLWSLRTEQKLAYMVAASAQLMKRAGLLEAFLETDAPKTDTAREALAGALREFHENGISAGEFEAGRSVLKAQFVRTNETKASRARTLGFFESSGLGVSFYEDFAAELSTLTFEETNAYIRRILDPARASWVIVGPER